MDTPTLEPQSVEPQSAVYVELPGVSEARSLLPAHLIGTGSAGLAVHLRGRAAEVAAQLAPRQQVALYFEVDAVFRRQPVEVRGVARDSDGVRVDLAALGAPVSAESRECYRVSAIAANLKAVLGTAEACSVLDVSAMGFSVYARAPFEPGTSVRTVLVHEDERIPGIVIVQNLRRTRGGRLRCGVRCRDDMLSNGALMRALPRINMELQRRQLARRSGLMAEEPPTPAQFTPRRVLGGRG
jgi:hypothetical protein